MPCVPRQPASIVLPRLDLQLKSQGFGSNGFWFLWVDFFLVCVVGFFFLLLLFVLNPLCVLLALQ